MDFIRGSVVRARAGRDKGGFFVVLEAGRHFALICDGGKAFPPASKEKEPSASYPDKKRVGRRFNENDRAIRKALRSFCAGRRRRPCSVRGGFINVETGRN